MGFQHQVHYRLGYQLIRSYRFQQSTVRFLSAVGKDTESHLLPRLYVGPLPESPIPLSQFISTERLGVGSSPTSSAPHDKNMRIVWREGAILQLSNDQSHYVTGVMRMLGPGSKKGRWSYDGIRPCVRVFDGQEEWVAHLELMDDLGSSGKNPRRRGKQDLNVLARCLAPLRTPATISEGEEEAVKSIARPALFPILCFAPPKKKERFQWILEKATELGMDAWLMLQTERTESAASRDYERKGQAYVSEAVEQCERLSFPQLLSYSKQDLGFSGDDIAAVMKGEDPTSTPAFSSLSELLEFLTMKENEKQDNNFSVLICRERSPDSTPIIQALQQIQLKNREGLNNHNQPSMREPDNKQPHCCLVFVGPEGGWSTTESEAFDRLCNEKKGVFWNVSLGSNVLRTDTAAAAAMTAFAFHKDQYS